MTIGKELERLVDRHRGHGRFYARAGMRRVVLRFDRETVGKLDRLRLAYEEPPTRASLVRALVAMGLAQVDDVGGDRG